MVARKVDTVVATPKIRELYRLRLIKKDMPPVATPASIENTTFELIEFD